MRKEDNQGIQAPTLKWILTEVNTDQSRFFN
jgi:hypothetical protein